MATKTTNYGLTKPDGADFYDVDVQNDNMDIIDKQMKANAKDIAQLNSDLNNRIEFTITSIDSKYAFTGNSYKHNGKVYINGYFHCNSPSVGITTCFFVPEGFRPKIKCGSACYTDDDVNFNNIGAVKIDTNGDITIYFPTVYSTCVYTSIVYDID